MQFSQYHLLQSTVEKYNLFSTGVLSFLIEYLLMIYERLCILSHWPMHLFLQKYHSVLITIPLPYSLKSGSVMPLALFFLLMIALTIQGLLQFYTDFRIFKKFFIYLSWLCQVSIVVLGLSLMAVSRSLISSCNAWASHCGGFFRGAQALGCGLQQLQHVGSMVAATRLQNTDSVVVAHTQLPHGMWDLPAPGIKLVSPELASGFFTTEPPGKPKNFLTSVENAIGILIEIVLNLQVTQSSMDISTTFILSDP